MFKPFLVVLVLGLSACSGATTVTVTVTKTVVPTPAPAVPMSESATPSPSVSPSVEPSPSESLSDSASPSASPAGIVVEITCYDPETFDSVVFVDYHEGWTAPTDRCEGKWVSGLGTAAQREAAVQRWTSKPASKASDHTVKEALGDAIASCAESGRGTYDYIGPDTQDPAFHIQQWKWMFKFCPDHPDRAKVLKLLGAEEAAQAAHPWFYGGGRVGKDFPAGTYVSSGNEGGCYWEYTDRSGNIMNNNISESPRMQVTIPSSAYAFDSENCNKWKKS
jgi:hypothetical protein